MSVAEARETPADRHPIACYELAPWAELGIVAGLTTSESDLGLQSEHSAREVLDSWRQFRHQMRPGFTTVAVAHQCHATGIAVHDALSPSPDWWVLDDHDGHITSRRGILVAITVADCIPVYLAHPATGTVGVLHAGWRGTAGGIVERGIELCCQVASSLPGDLVIHYGVGICGSCYEVGPEVVEAVTGRPAVGRSQLDLRGELARRARAVGVTRMTTSPWCSSHDHDRFHSHRFTRGQAGRMLAYVGMPAP